MDFSSGHRGTREQPNVETHHQVMTNELRALLVSDLDETVQLTEAMLLAEGIKTRLVRKAADVRAVLLEPDLPSLVFTGVSLADGTWADVLSAAKAAPRPVPVIVVSRDVDIRLYLDALESGAHDFLVPRGSSSDLAHIIRMAIASSSHSASPRLEEAR